MIHRAADRPKLAVYKFSSCDGCQLQLLNLEDELLNLVGAVEVAYFLEARRQQLPPPYDIGLVEGGVCNTENIETLREFRKSCDILIAVGACAMSGGVPALRNHIDVRELLEETYVNGIGVVHAQIPTDPELPHILEKVSPIHEVVKVDYFLPGCPPPADAFWEILNDLIEGRAPDLPYDLTYFD